MIRDSKFIHRTNNVCGLVTFLLSTAFVLSACQKATTAPTIAPQPAPTEVPSPTAAAVANEVTIKISGGAFSPKHVTIPAGTKVTWEQNDSRNHTVTADDGSFGSGTLGNGKSFSFTFTQLGVYAYYCSIHGGPGGQGMSGVVEVTNNPHTF